MNASAVLRILALLRAAGVDVWIGGGWGIDALVGRQTRPHRDLDLMHNIEHEGLLLSALGANGYTEARDLRPVRFVMTDPAGTELDLHPLVFSPDGSAVQAPNFDYPANCFVSGRIEQTNVPCLSAAQQIYFHQGYEPMEQDLHDMALLRATFGLTTHF